MYTQLKANVTSVLPDGSGFNIIGSSDLFVLTNVATVSFLSSLYNIPAGQTVHNMNATQALPEFYEEVCIQNSFTLCYDQFYAWRYI